MANISALNPLGYVIERQYTENIVIKNKLFKERLANARNLYRKDLLAHYGCVNAIEFSKEGEFLVSGGDDRRVLLWSVPKATHDIGCPTVLQTNHLSNIFCLAFNSTNTRIFSGGNDDTVLVHDANTGNLVVKLKHKNPVYGLSINPQNDNVLITAGDDGRILLFDLRETSNLDALCLAKEKTGFHSVMFNPTNPRWLVTANSEEGVALWDCRKPREAYIRYDQDAGIVSGISACFNSDGSRVLALRRRLPPVLYVTQYENAVCQFYHPSYYNSCTMKTCCFAGENDEYVLSGSDDFNLYMWQIPNNESEWGVTHLVLKDHRSIVNQVRYNKHNNLIASSGVEKMVKLWSTVPVGSWKGSLIKERLESTRLIYSHEDYINLVGHSGERISHDYSDQSTQEDSKMMAFFDSLIQREIEGWESSSDNPLTSDSDSDHDTALLVLTNKMFRHGKFSVEDTKKCKPNRIAQLIAMKRKKLAIMAFEKSSNSRHKSKEKSRKRKGSHRCKTSKSMKSSSSSKKSYSKSTQTIKESKHKFVPERSSLRKYRTRQSLKDLSDSGTSTNSIDAPSTSTGITNSNSSIFRIIEQDSDEDIPPNNCIEDNTVEPENFVNILPTPLNGSHDMYINVLEMSNSNNNNSNNNNNQANGGVVTIRNDDFNHTSGSNGVAVSHTDSCLTDNNCTNLYENQNDSPSCSNSHAQNNTCSINRFISSLISNNNSESDSDSDLGWEYNTPVKKRRTYSASDSGCATGACSSTSPYTTRALKNHQACSSNSNGYNDPNNSNGDVHYEKFKKRVKKARLNNIRKKIGIDSDSN